MISIIREKRNRAAGQAFTLIEMLVILAIIAILASIMLPAVRGALNRARTVQCLSNMRQWAAGVQMYLNDNNGVFPRDGMTGANLNYSKPSAWFNAVPGFMGIQSLSDRVGEGSPPRPRDGTIFSCPVMTMNPADLPPDEDPDSPNTPVFSYGYNTWIDHSRSRRQADRGGPSDIAMLATLEQVNIPSMFVVFAEFAASSRDSMYPYDMVFRHGDRDQINLAFADGHAQTYAHDVVAVEGTARARNRSVLWDPEGEIEE